MRCYVPTTSSNFGTLCQDIIFTADDRELGVRPSMSEQPTSRYAEEGESVTFKCEAIFGRTAALAVIDWYLVDSTDAMTNVIYLPGHQLHKCSTERYGHTHPYFQSSILSLRSHSISTFIFYRNQASLYLTINDITTETVNRKYVCVGRKLDIVPVHLMEDLDTDTHI